MSISLIGLVVLTIVNGMMLSVRYSTMNSESAKVEAVLGSAADQLAATSYENCPSQSTKYEDAVKTAAADNGWSVNLVSISTIKYWSPDTQTWISTNAATGAQCLPTAFLSTSKVLQLVSIKVVGPRTGFTRVLDVVMSDFRSREGDDV